MRDERKEEIVSIGRERKKREDREGERRRRKEKGGGEEQRAKSGAGKQNTVDQQRTENLKFLQYMVNMPL